MEIEEIHIDMTYRPSLSFLPVNFTKTNIFFLQNFLFYNKTNINMEHLQKKLRKFIVSYLFSLYFGSFYHII